MHIMACSSLLDSDASLLLMDNVDSTESVLSESISNDSVVSVSLI